ncbi:MAG TPA: hypothetical protein VEF34_10465 [Syntrophobacteraceae bacterium]|nr:hypothetical protein [Syntrophobacteraceae bacterium]
MRAGRISFFISIGLLVVFLAPATHASAQRVRHNPEIIEAIDREISTTLNERNLAVLRGLRWCVAFCDDDGNFEFTFSNYVTMLDELTFNNSRPNLGNIVHTLILKEFERALPLLSKLFPADADGYEDFISILPVAYHHQVPRGSLRKFARRHFTRVKPADRMRDFRRAKKRLDYDSLTDIVVGAAFIDMAYSWGVNEDFALPPNEYRTIMARCSDIPFTAGFNDDSYQDQNYYATHVLLALNHYGQRPLTRSPTLDRVLEYLSGQYETVRRRVGDLDLLCEYIYCFRQAAFPDAGSLDEGEQYVMSLQKSDGSWGTPEDFNGDPYDRLHPTWTAITLLALGLN